MSEFLSPTDPRWPAMWDALADATGDYADTCPETGESWQYMGTYDGVHQFRHRHRPQFKNGRAIQPIKGFAGQHWDRVYLNIDAATLRVIRVNARMYLASATRDSAARTTAAPSTASTSPATQTPDCEPTRPPAPASAGVFYAHSRRIRPL